MKEDLKATLKIKAKEYNRLPQDSAERTRILKTLPEITIDTVMHIYQWKKKHVEHRSEDDKFLSEKLLPFFDILMEQQKYFSAYRVFAAAMDNAHLDENILLSRKLSPYMHQAFLNKNYALGINLSRKRMYILSKGGYGTIRLVEEEFAREIYPYADQLFLEDDFYTGYAVLRQMFGDMTLVSGEYLSLIQKRLFPAMAALAKMGETYPVYDVSRHLDLDTIKPFIYNNLRTAEPLMALFSVAKGFLIDGDGFGGLRVVRMIYDFMPQNSEHEFKTQIDFYKNKMEVLWNSGKQDEAIELANIIFPERGKNPEDPFGPADGIRRNGPDRLALISEVKEIADEIISEVKETADQFVAQKKLEVVVSIICWADEMTELELRVDCGMELSERYPQYFRKPAPGEGM